MKQKSIIRIYVLKLIRHKLISNLLKLTNKNKYDGVDCKIRKKKDKFKLRHAPNKCIFGILYLYFSRYDLNFYQVESIKFKCQCNSDGSIYKEKKKKKKEC